MTAATATAAHMMPAAPAAASLEAASASAAPVHVAAVALLTHAVAVAGVVQRAAAVGRPRPVTRRGFVCALALRRRLAIMRGCAGGVLCLPALRPVTCALSGACALGMVTRALSRALSPATR
ncbi:MAG TPA: hypothetical protein VIR28_00725, partial [Achromobacter sp.]|uniref:hypothetical protein n=1 Tax=Achromobacter sp. TaxID=134375 RepID=UPI002F94A542